MPVVPKRLAQVALNASVTARYTPTGAVTAQITEIYLVNGSSIDRKVDIHQGGTATSNRIMRNIIVPADGTVILQNLKIVVAPSQNLAARQDTGTDVVMTIYGVEES